MAGVRELFCNHVISRFGDIPLPPRSPDLSVSDFSLWCYLKSRVSITRLTTLANLKQKIQEETHGIPTEMLHQTMGNVNGRKVECIHRGRHLQAVLVFLAEYWYPF